MKVPPNPRKFNQIHENSTQSKKIPPSPRKIHENFTKSTPKSVKFPSNPINFQGTVARATVPCKPTLSDGPSCWQAKVIQTKLHKQAAYDINQVHEHAHVYSVHTICLLLLCLAHQLFIVLLVLSPLVVIKIGILRRPRSGRPPSNCSSC